MSKKIEIKIAATGGEQAAAEVRKVDSAVEKQKTTLTGLENELKKASAAYKQTETSAEQLAAVSKRVDTATTELGATTSKVTAKGVQMGTGWQNVGYQLQDLAVQIGSGQSAFRAMGQQLPQLLSGFGPMGILLGTVSAVALPLAGAMFELGTATGEAGKKAEEAAEKLAKLSEKRTAKSAAAALKENKAFIDSLDDEEAAITRVNEAMARNIELREARRAAEASVADAEDDLEKARIAADPNLTDAQKIEQSADIDRRAERRRFEERKGAASGRIADAATSATQAEDAATRKSADVAALETRLKEQEEAAKIRGQIGRADAAAASLPALDEKIKKAKEPVVLPPNATPYLIEKVQEKQKEDIARLEKQRDETAKIANSVSPKQREDLIDLEGKNRDGGTIAETTAAIEALKKEAEALAAAAAKAKADADLVRQRETIGVEGDFRVTSRRIEASQITSGAAAADAAAEADAAAKAKAAADAERGRREEPNPLDAGKVGMEIEKLIPDGVSSQFRAAVEKASAALQDGGTAEELEEMARLLAQLGGSTNSAVAGLKSEIAAARQQIATLTAQLKNR
jgi:hypothetical protein